MGIRRELIDYSLQIWGFLFIAFFGASWLATDPHLRLATQLLFGIPLLIWAALRLRGPRDWLDVAVLVALATHLVVALASRDRTGALEATGLATAWALLFWLMRELVTQPRVRALLSVAAAYAIVIWLGATAAAWIGEKVTWVMAGGGMPEFESYQVFIWGTANVFPVLALLAVPFIAWLPSGRMRSLLAGLLAAAALVIVPFSMGRAGWLGMAVALGALEPLSDWPVGRRLLARTSPRLPAWLPLAVASVSAGAAAAVVVGTTRIGPMLAETLDTRLRLWDQALGIFAAAPLTGSGPSTYSWARLEHVSGYADRVGAILAHNVPLQTVADGGLLLTLGFASVIVVWLVTMLKRRLLLDTGQRLAAAALIGVAAVSLFDDFSFLPAVGALIVTLAAWTVPYPAQDGALPGQRRFGLAAVAAGVMLLTIPSVVNVALARVEAASGRAAAVAGSWSTAQEHFEAAVDRYGTHGGYWLGVALARVHAGDEVGAVEAYDRVRQLAPGDPRPWGALAHLTGDEAERMELLEHAARRSNSPGYVWRLARALREVGSGEAPDFAAIAVVLDSRLYAELGAIDVERSAVRSQLDEAMRRVGRLEDVDPESPRWDADLHDGTLPPDAPPQWTAVAEAAADRLAVAERQLEAARDQAPHEARTHQAAMAVARFKCDRGEYEAALQLERLTADRLFGSRPVGVAEQREPVYRDLGLGDYQPPGVLPLPVLDRWPGSLVHLPDCGWD
jgi:O-antigen ligase